MNFGVSKPSHWLPVGLCAVWIAAGVPGRLGAAEDKAAPVPAARSRVKPDEGTPGLSLQPMAPTRVLEGRSPGDYTLRLGPSPVVHLSPAQREALDRRKNFLFLLPEDASEATRIEETFGVKNFGQAPVPGARTRGVIERYLEGSQREGANSPSADGSLPNRKFDGRSEDRSNPNELRANFDGLDRTRAAKASAGEKAVREAGVGLFAPAFGSGTSSILNESRDRDRDQRERSEIHKKEFLQLFSGGSGPALGGPLGHPLGSPLGNPLGNPLLDPLPRTAPAALPDSLRMTGLPKNSGDFQSLPASAGGLRPPLAELNTIRGPGANAADIPRRIEPEALPVKTQPVRLDFPKRAF